MIDIHYWSAIDETCRAGTDDVFNRDTGVDDGQSCGVHACGKVTTVRLNDLWITNRQFLLTKVGSFEKY